MPPLETLWLYYLRRFAREHWYRFAKQRLQWTQPQCSSVPAGERWGSLMPLLSWQLWWARDDCTDHPLPGRSPQVALLKRLQAFLPPLAPPRLPPKGAVKPQVA